MATKKAAKGSTKKPAAKKATTIVGTARVTILGHSATSVFKWMGTQDWTSEQAKNVVTKLAQGGEVKPSTISTGLSDGRSEKYRKGAATLTKDEIAKLKAAAK